MRIVDLSQGSSAWGDWRSLGIGASDACIVVSGSHFGRDRQSLWREKLGLENKKARSWAMSEGARTEADTREWFEAVTGHTAIPLCVMHDDYPWIKASLDGWITSCSTPVEIKYARKEWHDEALAGTVPETYQPQLNHQLIATGAKSMFYVSFNPRYPVATRYALVEYTPEKKVLEEHLRLLKSFWRCVSEKVPPVDEDFTVGCDTCP